MTPSAWRRRRTTSAACRAMRVSSAIVSADTSPPRLAQGSGTSTSTAAVTDRASAQIAASWAAKYTSAMLTARKSNKTAPQRPDGPCREDPPHVTFGPRPEPVAYSLGRPLRSSSKGSATRAHARIAPRRRRRGTSFGTLRVAVVIAALLLHLGPHGAAAAESSGVADAFSRLDALAEELAGWRRSLGDSGAAATPPAAGAPKPDATDDERADSENRENRAMAADTHGSGSSASCGSRKEMAGTITALRDGGRW